MEFQLINIELKSDSEIYLYGKALSSLDQPMQTIRVTGIVSPVYFLPAWGKDESLISDIKSYASADIEVEYVKRVNIFHKSLRRHLNLLKITFSQKICFKDFESDYCELVFTEFQNPVENFIISRAIKGPGIILIDNYKKNSTSLKDVKFLRNAKFPILQTASVAFELKNNNISRFVYYNKNKKKFVKAKVGNSGDASYKAFHDYRDILVHLNNTIKLDNPDVIVVHNCHQRSRLNIKDKIFCDIFSFANGTMKGRDFSIQEICSTYKICRKNGLEGDAVAIIDIFDAMSALNLAKEMAEISGYILNKCLSNCRAERIEYTLLHELYAKDYIFPPDIPKQNIKYAGGLVLEPIQGFYEDVVLLLDFNSLYPSIIQEFNVCFSNIGSSDFYLTEENNQNLLSDANILSSIAEEGEETFLPKILRNLVKRRRSVKEMIKNCKTSEERDILGIRQNALKLTANSIYGCLGSPISRFCNFEMAAFITAKGRELLNETKIVAEKMNMRVIYGDTDSIMIHTKYPGKNEYYSRAIEDSKALVEKVNSKYKNIEIETEKAFKKLLLYTKKKYSALVFDMNGSHIETKGLDIVRRDFCLASSDLNRSILNIILQDKEVYSNAADVTNPFLNEAVEENLLNPESYKNNTMETVEKIYSACLDFYNSLSDRPNGDFVISTVLNKDLSAYNVLSHLPHIALALRLKNTKNFVYRQDDVVSYIIGEGDGDLGSRAYHPEETFKIDYSYYIKHQILPSLYRLVSILKFMRTEKISMIFNVNGHSNKTISRYLTFSTPCCENIQEPALDCMKCSQPISKLFYIQKVAKMIADGTEKCYKVKGECIDCGVLYSNHLLRCIECSKDLTFKFFNEEFDNLLGSIESSFSKMEINEISNILAAHFSVSSYRNIDLRPYFSEEIERFKIFYKK